MWDDFSGTWRTDAEKPKATKKSATRRRLQNRAMQSTASNATPNSADKAHKMTKVNSRVFNKIRILISWEHSKLMLKPYFRSTSEGQLAGVTRLWDRRNFLRRRETDWRAVVQSVSSPWCDQGLPIWPIFFCTLLTKVEAFVDVFFLWGSGSDVSDEVFVTETRLYILKKYQKPTYKT